MRFEMVYCFYSKLVRLKVIVRLCPLAIATLFLFQTGSIKSEEDFIQVPIIPQFLFQTGSIKRHEESNSNLLQERTFLFQTGSIKS